MCPLLARELVIAGLVPAIHVFELIAGVYREFVDARHFGRA
jgi:hypothetical protein